MAHKRTLKDLAIDVVGYGACVAVVCALIYAVWWVNAFTWDECRKVGHSVLYCLLTHGH
jgi:hypothetical protein